VYIVDLKTGHHKLSFTDDSEYSEFQAGFNTRVRAITAAHEHYVCDCGAAIAVSLAILIFFSEKNVL
jgi:hypothetical protein